MAPFVSKMNATPELHDMKTLAPDTQLNDMIIRTMLGLEWEANDKDNLHVVDRSYISAAFLDPENRRMRFEPTATLFVAPVHHPTIQHWTLLVIGLKTKTATNYDSYPNGVSERFEKVAKEILPMMLTIIGKEMDQEHSCRLVKGECAIQEGVDCGVHVIVNATSIMREKRISLDVDGPQKRLEFARRITQARW